MEFVKTNKKHKVMKKFFCAKGRKNSMAHLISTIFLICKKAYDKMKLRRKRNERGDKEPSPVSFAFIFEKNGIGVKYDTKITFTKVIDPRI